jgi:hypothetical protein
MFTTGRNLVSLYTSRQSYRPLELAVGCFLIILPLLLGFSFPRNRKDIPFRMDLNVFGIEVGQ